MQHQVRSPFARKRSCFGCWGLQFRVLISLLGFGIQVVAFHSHQHPAQREAGVKCNIKSVHDGFLFPTDKGMFFANKFVFLEKVLFIAWPFPDVYQMSTEIRGGMAQMRVCTERFYSSDGSGLLFANKFVFLEKVLSSFSFLSSLELSGTNVYEP